MDYIGLALGVLLSLFIVGVSYVFTLLVYFKARKAGVTKTFSTEIKFAIVAYALSVIVRFCIMVVDYGMQNMSALNGLEFFMRAVYSAIGGFAFEGLEGYETLSVGARCIYVGTSLYVGLVVLTVVSTQLSHSIYSRFLFVMHRLTRGLQNFFGGSSFDYYIFTSITEDSITLANSIKQNDKSDRDKRAIIIFSGQEVGSFDRSNPLHAAIMARGYLYLPMLSNDQNTIKIIEHYGCFVDNDYVFEPEKCKTLGTKPRGKFNKNLPRVRVFALDINDDRQGLEALNSKIIFNEIKAVLGKLVTAKKGKLRIADTICDFYVLTQREVNYGMYDAVIDGLITERLNQLDYVLDGVSQSSLVKLIKKYIQLHVMNEAVVTGVSLAQARCELFEHLDEQNSTSTSAFLQDVETPTYRVLSLGFGDNGREALNAIMVMTSACQTNGEPKPFIADVYDVNMPDISGVYSHAHPMFDVRTFGLENGNSVFANNIKNMFGESAMKKRFSDLLEQGVITEQEKYTDLDKFAKNSGVPIINLYDQSSFGAEFLNSLESEETPNGLLKFAYNAIIIALGDDENNVLMANTLIDNFKHTLDTSGQTLLHPITIYVNLRKSSSFCRVNFTQADKAVYSRLHVVPFGNAEYVFSYDHIIDETVEMRYNFVYDKIYSYSDKIDAVFNDYKAGKSVESLGVMKEILASYSAPTPAESLASWLDITLFQKHSNLYASLFSGYHKNYVAECVKNGGFFAKDLVFLCKVEHVRWNRFHMANGYVFFDYTAIDMTKGENATVFHGNFKEKRAECRRNKEHDCLCPFEFIFKQINDAPNIILALEDLHYD